LEGLAVSRFFLRLQFGPLQAGLVQVASRWDLLASGIPVVIASPHFAVLAPFYLSTRAGGVVYGAHRAQLPLCMLKIGDQRLIAQICEAYVKEISATR